MKADIFDHSLFVRGTYMTASDSEPCLEVVVAQTAQHIPIVRVARAAAVGRVDARLIDDPRHGQM